MYNILVAAHSGWRYIVFIMLIVAVINAALKMRGGREFTGADRRLTVFALIATHIQVLMGLIIYFIRGWYGADSHSAIGRYFKMEHIAIMLIAAVLVTIGNSRSKKAASGSAKFTAVAIFYGLALLLIIVGIALMVHADPTRSFFGMSRA